MTPPARPTQPEPIDPDQRVSPPAGQQSAAIGDAMSEPPRAGRRPSGEGPVLLVVAAGGVVGALARYEAGVIWPTAPTAFPWTTFGINVLGCLFIGVLIVLVSEVLTTHRLVRPLLGTGVLGGFTTFSTYAIDAHRLISRDRAGLALLYLAATVAAALLAVTVGTRLTRLAARRFRGLAVA